MSQAGIVNLSDTPLPPTILEDIAVQTGTSPVVPAANTITFNGAVVAAGTNPVQTDGTGAHTMALNVQLSQAIASTNSTNVGLSAFNSADFTVDANGFVSIIEGAEDTGNPIGSLAYFANANGDTYATNAGWLKCNDQIVSQSTYSTLFSIMGLINGPGYASWTTTATGIASQNYALTYGNGVYVIAGTSGSIATSATGTSWTTTASGTSSSILALTYGNGLYIYAGNGGIIGTSTNGLIWTTTTSGTTSSILCLTYGNGVFAYGGNGGVAGTSTNGLVWTTTASGTTSSIASMTYGNGIYVYGGVGGVLATSSNTTTWTIRTSGTTSEITSLTYGNSLYLYGTTGGGLATSTNASTWTQRTSNTTSSISGLAYGNGLYIYGAFGGVVGTSTNATSWATTVPSVGNIFCLIYNPSIFIYGDLSYSGYSTYTYNSSTQFQIPNDAQLGITTESLTNFQRSLYIKAL